MGHSYCNVHCLSPTDRWTGGEGKQHCGAILRTFAAANERHWDRLLALAEFSYNSHIHKATEMSPFEADTAENPRMPLDVLAAASRRPGGEAIAVSLATKLNDILQQLTDALKISQATTAAAANKLRQPHDFQVGDSVFLNTRHLPLGYANAAGEVVEKEGESGARLSRALQQRFTGPHCLLKARGDNAFELDIPEHLRISRTRNVSEFRRNQVDHSRPQAPPPPIHVSRTGQAEYDIESIVGWRERAGVAEFEVKWAGYTDADNTWEPYTNLTRFGSGCKEIFKAFVEEVNDQDLRQLLPKSYGGTGIRRRKSRRG